MSDAAKAEAIIDSDLPIVDPHHHLWFFSQSMFHGHGLEDNMMTRVLLPAFRGKSRYLLDGFLADLNRPLTQNLKGKRSKI